LIISTNKRSLQSRLVHSKDQKKILNIIIIIIIVLRHFSALQYWLDGFPDMPLSHITRFCAIGDVAYTGVEADVLWPDALPDANPTYS
jgi:hypothetical protein